MSSSPRSGGLILSGRAAAPVALRDGADVSWLPRCRVGDDQGAEGACAMFALASWAEIVFGQGIADREVLGAYETALSGLGRKDGGLLYTEAFTVARDAGWLPGMLSIEPARDLSALGEQPVLGAYAITPAWDQVSEQGCLDHAAGGTVRGYHAVVIAAHGEIGVIPGGPWVYIENSWGVGWGWNGIGVMSEELHGRLCQEVWVLRCQA